MNLTATDRKSLIRLASSMEKGSAERRAILAGLKTAVRTAAAKPLQWSVDWTKIMERILATYPITEAAASGWSVARYLVSNPEGGGRTTPSREKAVQQALEWFLENLEQVAKRYK
jgi:hypothetical protein